MAAEPERNERDLALVVDIVLAAEDALSFIADINEQRFAASRLHQNAVIRSLEIVGKVAGKLSQEFRRAHPTVPWREITGMRHRLAHDYGGVRLDVVWRTARNLPILIGHPRPLAPSPE